MQSRGTTRELLHRHVAATMHTLLETRPWREITMNDVARAAGVSRQTLYNEFGSRQGLAGMATTRVAGEFLDQVERVVHNHADDKRAALVGAVGLFLDAAHAQPFVRAVEASAGVEGVAAFVAAETGTRVVAYATGRLTEIICDTWPEIDPARVPPFAETVIRLAISHLTVPTAPAPEAAAEIATVLEPYIDTVTGD